MNLPWTTSEFGRAAESAHENFFASISWDAMTCWFASGGLRDSPCGPGSCAVLRSELQVSRTCDREEFARIYPCPTALRPIPVKARSSPGFGKRREARRTHYA
jgi:hypothetical protein